MPSLSPDEGKYSNLLRQIGEQIRDLRKSKGLSQLDICAIIEADKSFISNIENGHTNVTIKTLCKIAYSLGVDVKILFE